MNINYDNLPEHMQYAAKAYIEGGVWPGDFLRAVLKNDLVEAFVRADNVNSICMRDWAEWVYSIPRTAWKNSENIDAWIAVGGMNGLRKATENPEQAV